MWVLLQAGLQVFPLLILIDIWPTPIQTHYKVQQPMWIPSLQFENAHIEASRWWCVCSLFLRSLDVAELGKLLRWSPFGSYSQNEEVSAKWLNADLLGRGSISPGTAWHAGNHLSTYQYELEGAQAGVLCPRRTSDCRADGSTSYWSESNRNFYQGKHERVNSQVSFETWRRMLDLG